MKITVQEDWYSLEQCNANPHNIYVFGDNFKHFGNGGQAMIRSAKNSIGLATKKLPSQEANSFFDDSLDDFVGMLTDIYKLYQMTQHPAYADYTMVFPKAGLGTGLSELPTRAPFINQQLMLLLHQYFGIATAADGTLSMIGE